MGDGRGERRGGGFTCFQMSNWEGEVEVEVEGEFWRGIVAPFAVVVVVVVVCGFEFWESVRCV